MAGTELLGTRKKGVPVKRPRPGEGRAGQRRAGIHLMSLSVGRVGFRNERQSRKFQAAGDDQGLSRQVACCMLDVVEEFDRRCGWY